MESPCQRLFEEFRLYGGYPEVVLAKTEDEKNIILKNIYNTYFLREVKEILNIKEDYKLSKLIKSFSLQLGNIIDIHELAQITDFSAYEIKKQLNLLEKTFIYRLGSNYHRNKRNELKKSNKIFFIDNGFRNIAINNFTKERTDLGALNENYVATELIKKEIEIKYWRTKSKAEVDFVIEKNDESIPVEVKSKIREKGISNSLMSFIKTNKPRKCIVFSDVFASERKIDNTKIIFRPLVCVEEVLKEL